MVRVLVASAVRLVREGLADLLSRQPGFQIVGMVGDAGEVDARVAATRPDVLFADAGLLSEARVVGLRLGHADLGIVVLGRFDDPETVLAYAEAGISGFIAHDQTLDELVQTLESVVRGELYCDPHVAAVLLRRVTEVAANGGTRSKRSAVRLTARELEIAMLLGDRLSNKQIARNLHIEVATVKNHVHNILEKLGVESRVDAASWVRSGPSGR